MIVKLKDSEGQPVLVNTDNVTFVTLVKVNGKLVIGKCMIISIGTTMVVDGTLEEIYGLLRRPEPRGSGHGVYQILEGRDVPDGPSKTP